MSGITNPAEEYFKDGLWGWDGSTWRKLPMLWGYSDRYAESQARSDAASGWNGLTFSTVPAGEVWRVTSVVWINSVSSCSTIIGYLYTETNVLPFATEETPVANEHYVCPCNLTLKAGDKLGISFLGCTLHDNLFAWALGYKMTVAG